MAILKINPTKIEGCWVAGVALDYHTTSSTLVGHNEFGHPQFATVRPEIAELLYRLKNRSDKSAVNSIVDTAVHFLSPYRSKFDAIVPVPPSRERKVQPVAILAQGIGDALGIPVLPCVSVVRSTAQLKNISDPDERKTHVAGLYAVDQSQTRGRDILLFDDLYRSGTTLNAIADMLMNQGQANTVRALTITRTRSNR